MLGSGGKGRGCVHFACGKYVNVLIICGKRVDCGELKRITFFFNIHPVSPIESGWAPYCFEQQITAEMMLCYYPCLGFKTGRSASCLLQYLYFGVSHQAVRAQTTWTGHMEEPWPSVPSEPPAELPGTDHTTYHPVW